MKKYVLNPDYILHNDITRIVLTSSNMSKNNITSFIHPLYAVILCIFDMPTTIEDGIFIAQKTLKSDNYFIRSFIEKIINNKESYWVGNDNISSELPTNVLIEQPVNYQKRNYNYTDFIIDAAKLDLASIRFNVPIETTLMINTKCYTDCIYCYANRKERRFLDIPIERLLSIIDEAKQLKFKSFNISGGEFFLENNWKTILQKLISHDFQPIIPTKIPLKEVQIKNIKECGLDELQISLDAINPSILSTHLKVTDDYWILLNNTFHNLEKYNQKFRVNCIITKYNCHFDDIDRLIQYLLQFTNFHDISIGVASYSLYKTHTQNINFIPEYEKSDVLFSKLRSKYGTYDNVLISSISTHTENFHYNNERFFTKAKCTGNYQGFFILPDGQVTICEELYWHPHFILGNLCKQTIMEMWNSIEAKKQIDICQTEFSENSYCRICDSFKNCHSNGNKCWKEVMKVFGIANWDYPDPRCEHSPFPINKTYSDEL